MAGYRKLGRTSSQRKAMLRNLTTNLLYHGEIVTTDTRAKETRRIAEKLITLAIKEADNYTVVTVKAKAPKRNEKGMRVKELVSNKKGDKKYEKVVYEEIEKTIKKDNPSRLNARRKILSVLYPVVEAPKDGRKKRQNSVQVDMANKLFDEIAPKYKDNRNSGFTRIIKIGPRKGDGAPQVKIELV